MAQPPERYPVEEAKAAVSFLREVRARFASHPPVHNEFYALLAGFGKGEITDFSAVVTRAEALLQDQPDLIARFNAFLAPNPKPKIEPPTRRRHYCGKAAQQERWQPPRGRANARSDLYGSAGVRDGTFDKALQFLQRVKHTDTELYDRLLAELSMWEMEGRMDAHQIYARAEGIFGPAQSDLLRDFAEFLPAEHDPPPRSAEEEPEEHRRTSKRKPAPSAVPADVPNKLSRAKKPRADDRKNRHVLIDVSEGGTGGGATAQDDNDSWRSGRHGSLRPNTRGVHISIGGMCTARQKYRLDEEREM